MSALFWEPVSPTSATTVVCIDKDQRKIDALHQGKMPIFEPGLDGLVARNVAAGRLTFGTDLGTLNNPGAVRPEMFTPPDMEAADA